jgi:predicted nucleic acid-binding protein
MVNPILVEEYLRHAARWRLPHHASLAEPLLSRVVLHVPSVATLTWLAQRFPELMPADLAHAATCVETGATLVTNDRDFDAVGDSGIIPVWSITEALRHLA